MFAGTTPGRLPTRPPAPQAADVWRRRNPHYDHQDRVSRRLVKDVPLDRADPMRGIDWEAARDEVGVEITVLVEETGKLILQWARDDILV